MANGSALNPLVGIIDSVKLFGESVTLPAIKRYNGEPLFITRLALDATNTLEIDIDDVGPPAGTMVLAAAPKAAFATITYKRNAKTSATTQNPIVYKGKPLIIRAILPQPGPGKWDNSEVVPSVEEWQLPAISSTYPDRLDFVILNVANTDGTLWWLANPLLISQPPSSTVVPGAGGIGVNGPWGVETP